MPNNQDEVLRLAMLAASEREQHEALCRRCGKCCYDKLRVAGRLLITHKPCRYLDVKTNECKVYPKRFEVNAQCKSVEDGIRLGLFPADCPYVQGLPGYVPAVEME